MRTKSLSTVMIEVQEHGGYLVIVEGENHALKPEAAARSTIDEALQAAKNLLTGK